MAPNLLMNPGVLNARAVFAPKFPALSTPEIAIPKYGIRRQGGHFSTFQKQLEDLETYPMRKLPFRP